MITLNRLNTPTKKHRLVGWIQKDPYIQLLKETHFRSAHLHTDVRMEKGIPCEWKSKENWSRNTYIRKNTL